MDKKKEKKIMSYATVAFVAIGLLSLSYGVYSSNPSMHTLTGKNEINYFEFDEKSFGNADMRSLYPSIYQVGHDPNAIDQIQNSFPGGLNQYVGTSPTGVNMLPRQLGYNDREPWNGFEVIVARHGMPTEPLYIGIRTDVSNLRDPLTGDYDFLAYLDASSLPNGDTFYWVGSSYQIPGITAGVTWSIILISFNDGDFDDYWMWACSDQHPYSRGEGQFWDGTRWQSAYGGTLDLCFRTYTIPSDPEEPPVIAITVTSSVITMTFGIFSLLAAAATGTRYFWIGAL